MNVLLKDEKTDADASLWSLCAFSVKYKENIVNIEYISYK